MTAPMTDAEIREALARAERATSGPWTCNKGDCIGYDERKPGGADEAPSWDVSGPFVIDCGDWTALDEPNAEFIAHARTDVPRLAADLLAARAERDEARAELEETEGDKQNLLKTLECVTCKGSLMAPLQCAHCIETERIPEGMPQRPATTVFRLRAEAAETELAELRRWKDTHSVGSTLRTRAETAEARCRELEAERAIVADYLRDTDADFRARRPSERAVLDALLSPPPPHTCQIHRATSGASDCGLSPCEEAKVHTDRGASRPATVRRVQAQPSPEATETWRDAIGCAPSPPGSISSEEAVRRVRDGEATPFEADTAHEAAKCATCEGCGFVCDHREPPGKCVSALYCVPENNRRPCPNCRGGA